VLAGEHNEIERLMVKRAFLRWRGACWGFGRMTPSVSSLLMVIGLWLFLALFCRVGSGLEPTKPLTPPNPSINVSAAQLISEYKANEIAADQKYKGLLIQVTGKVDHVGKDILDSMYVTLKGDGKYEFVSVQCFFDDDWAKRLSYLSEGDPVTIQGTCNGKFGNVLLKNCEFSSR
jgi:tRNA_anti-like